MWRAAASRPPLLSVVRSLRVRDCERAVPVCLWLYLSVAECRVGGERLVARRPRWPSFLRYDPVTSVLFSVWECIGPSLFIDLRSACVRVRSACACVRVCVWFVLVLR